MSVEQLFGNTPRTILAPMAGYTDAAFRTICHSFGAGLTVTEMVSSKALVMNNSLTKTLLKRFEGDSPCFVQIFGHEPQVMAQSVQLEEMQNFDGVDINMGCPVRKIVSNGDGSALLENIPLASQCIYAVKKALGNKLLSVKFRLGVRDANNAAEFAAMCAHSGADFVTVHFRTRQQMYSGKADFSTLPQIAKCGVPVLANGDVENAQQLRQLQQMGAFGVSVGRGALGRPWIFAKLAETNYTMDVLQTINLHMQMLRQYLPERIVVNEAKKHISCYLKGMRNAKQTVVAVMQSDNANHMLSLIQTYFQQNPQFAVVQG